MPNLSRREALKILAAATGAAGASTLPERWDTPLVKVGALPAAAGVTPHPTSTEEDIDQ